MASPLRAATQGLLCIAVIFNLSGCGDNNAAVEKTSGGKADAAPKDAAPKRAGPPATLITVTQAQRQKLEVTEDTVGTLENVIDPRVGAEVAGRIIRVLVQQGQSIKQGQLLAEIDSQDWVIQSKTDQAEVKRLESLLTQQERLVERQQALQKQGFISQNAVDDALAQRDAQREQLVAARSRNDSSKNSLRKAAVLSPISGRVQEQIVTDGDYVKVGDPLFQLVGTLRLVAHLPFPESALSRLRVGLPVRISSPTAPDLVIKARIDEIRPTVTASSRALDVIVKFETDERLRGGGTVNAAVVTAEKPEVVMVPEQSVILRPAGKVVYIVEEGRARQRIVETGTKRNGLVEIIQGLQGGETIAQDGAGFLTDNTAVALPKPAAAGAGKAGGKGDGGGKGGAGKAGDAGKADKGVTKA
jgi:membrane fusion protein, multidrug efflux system